MIEMLSRKADLGRAKRVRPYNASASMPHRTMIAPRIVSFFIAAICLVAPVVAWADKPEYALGIDGKYVDPNGIWEVATRSMLTPINRKYKELTKVQRDAVKAAYEPMPEDDEPPFPEDGLEPILRALSQVQDMLQVTGKLTLAVDVGPDGIATSIQIQGSPTPGMTRFASEYFLLTKYKAAVCGGKPCRMQWAFSMVFVPGGR